LRKHSRDGSSGGLEGLQTIEPLVSPPFFEKKRVGRRGRRKKGGGRRKSVIPSLDPFLDLPLDMVSLTKRLFWWS